MKVTKKLISLLLVCLMSCAFLFGCGKPEGTYKFHSMVVIEDGKSKTYTVGELYQEKKLEEDMLIIILKQENDKNIAILRSNGFEGEEVTYDTEMWYEGYEKEIYIGNVVCKKDGKKLILKMSDDVEITLKK